MATKYLTSKHIPSKRNPVAATLRNFKASRLGDKRSVLAELHAWHDLVEATRKPSEIEDFRDIELSHWHDDVCDRDCGSWWND